MASRGWCGALLAAAALSVVLLAPPPRRDDAPVRLYPAALALRPLASASPTAAPPQHSAAAAAAAAAAPPSPWRARACVANCSSRGTCNLDTGECVCRQGYDGAGCGGAETHACNAPEGDEFVSRCAGRCDEARLRCECGGGRFPRRAMFQCEFRGISAYLPWKGEGWNHARVAPSPGHFYSRKEDAPPWLRRWWEEGRPGAPPAGHVPWCDAAAGERLAAACNCHDGAKGRLCEVAHLTACLNQCHGRGACAGGECVCDAPFYGVDCSLRRGQLLTAAGVPAGAARRPAVYVYELPPRFNLRLWTAKTEERDCTIRAYTEKNGTKFHMHAFGMEVALYESLLASPHRTNDPAAADFFYVPVWAGCWLSRFSRPTPGHHALPIKRDYHLFRLPRAHRASDMVRQALNYIRGRFPYFNRSRGADHIFSFPHDEGACLAPIELSDAILVTHWGRTELNPPNHTTISAGQGWHEENPKDPSGKPYYMRMYGSRQCFLPGKDVLLPIFKSRRFVQSSPFLTGVRLERKILFSFLGNAVNQPPRFSMGLRQQVWAAHSDRRDSCIPQRCQQHNAACDLEEELRHAAHHCVLVGGHTRNFIRVLQRSVFCAVVPGNGWAHIEEPVVQGCIPVVIMPGIHVQLEGVLDVSRFSVRIARHEIPRLVDILRAIPEARVARMQAELAKVWERFTYSGLFKREFAWQQRARSSPRLRARVGDVLEGDTPSFAPIEGRLRGADAVDGFLELLRLRKARQQRAEPSSSAEYIDHGPEVQPLMPLPGYNVPDTRGVQ